MEIKDIENIINDTDMILIGVGDEFAAGLNDDGAMDFLNRISLMLEHKNYFIVATFDNDILRKTMLNQKRIVYPYLAENNEEEGKQWELYNKWLSATLAKRLLIIELGEGFKNPNVIRWPFERITMINNKAKFIRIHSALFQVPAELQEKAESIQKNAYEFVKEWINHCDS